MHPEDSGDESSDSGTGVREPSRPEYGNDLGSSSRLLREDPRRRSGGYIQSEPNREDGAKQLRIGSQLGPDSVSGLSQWRRDAGAGSDPSQPGADAADGATGADRGTLMATTPIPQPTGAFEAWLPLLESLANAGLTIGGLPGIAALAGAVEGALNPLLTSIVNKSTTQQDILAGWGAAIGIWTAIGNQANLDPAVKAKVSEYIAAGQQATAKFYLAQQGFDASLYAPVTPID